VLLAYVDESYTEGWFTMAALLVDGPEAVALSKELDRVSADASKAYGLKAGIELHGHEIFHASGAWDPPHSVVLQHLLERVDECVTGAGEYALVIADEVDGQAKHRADLMSYQDVGTAGYRHRKLTRIVDTLHFAPSDASRLVQAADVITFLYRRVYTHSETDERSRKAKVAMWKRLEPRVYHELCWFPSAEGQGHLWGKDFR
jgi:hypothetical protein